MDGYLKIKTKLDNSQIDSDVKKLQEKIEKLENQNNDYGKQISGLENQKQKYDELINKAKEYENEIQKLVVPTNQPNINADKIREYQTALTETNAEIEKQSSKYNSIESKISRLKIKQNENIEKIKEASAELDKIEVDKVKNKIDSVGNSITKQISTIGKMAMAVIGVRTAWAGVQKAINLAKQYSPQVSADFEYMGYALSQIVIPFIQKLVNLLYTVLSYVNAITSAWFGINLFANSSVASFKKMKESASDIADSTEKAQKAMQGFDEMNIQDNSEASNSNGNSGTNIVMPSYDLSTMDMEVPSWLQWIVDNKDIVIAALAGIAGGIIAIKSGLDLIKALGIGALIAGIVYIIESLVAYLNDPSWSNFGSIIQGIGVAILGIGAIIGSVPAVVARCYCTYYRNYNKILGTDKKLFPRAELIG